MDENVTGGVTFNRKLWTARNHILGAWGDVQLGWPVPHELHGRDCWCGRSGCLETFISAKGIETDFMAGNTVALSIDQITEKANQNDIIAELVPQSLDVRLRRGGAMLANMLNPDIIISAGQALDLERLYANIPRTWEGYAFAGKSATKRVRTLRGIDTTVSGAFLHDKPY